MDHDYYSDQLEQNAEEATKAENKAVDDNDKKEEESWPHSKIRFDLDKIELIEVKARSMITALERKSIWFQPSDFSKMSSMNRSTVKTLRENPNIDEPDLCIRGLEHKLHGESDRINEIKVNSIFSVLKEQSRQRKSNDKNALKIAQIYKEHVFPSVKKAQEMGLSDEKSAIQEETVVAKVERRRSSAAFDDFDLKELQDLDLHDDMDRFEWRMSEIHAPTDAPTEIYEKRNKDKEPRKKSKRETPLSPSPLKRERSATKRSKSPKPGKSSVEDESTKSSMPRVLSGKLSSLMRGSSKPNGERSSMSSLRKSLQRRGGKRQPELPLPGAGNKTLSSKSEKSALRKTRSDMF
jgi:hypothetical protein